MMWECFSWYGQSELMAELIVKDIQKRFLAIPFLEGFEEDYGEYFFQQDNAPIHTSRQT